MCCYPSGYVVNESEPPALPRLPDSGRQAACNIIVGDRVYCIDPLEDALQVISKRWALLVIGILGNRDEVRFNEAKRTIPGLSARALSDVLTALQEAGLVDRSVDPDTSPPAVTYALTPRGQELRTALLPLLEWAETPPHKPLNPARGSAGVPNG